MIYEFTDSTTKEKFLVEMDKSLTEVGQLAKDCKSRFGEITCDRLTMLMEERQIEYDFPCICTVNI